ncbi:unnamed protein product [Closterium sp. NIES-53]
MSQLCVLAVALLFGESKCSTHQKRELYVSNKEKLHWLKMQDSQPDLSNRALAKLAKVQPCQIRDWKKMRERLEVASSCRRRLMRAGRKPSRPSRAPPAVRTPCCPARPYVLPAAARAAALTRVHTRPLRAADAAALLLCASASATAACGATAKRYCCC